MSQQRCKALFYLVKKKGSFVKRQIRYTGESIEENPGETEDRYDCLKDFPDTDVTRAGSWPRQVPLGLTPVLGRRNFKMEEKSGRPNTR